MTISASVYRYGLSAMLAVGAHDSQQLCISKGGVCKTSLYQQCVFMFVVCLEVFEAIL